jgi:hypothetical protein
MSSHALQSSEFLGPEFNAFLFESVGLDECGRPLSVVSALARLDLDAWAEAAQLARLPKDLAAIRLAAFIRKFAEYPQVVRDAHKTAVRLVALLPSRAALAGQKPAMAAAPGQAKNARRSSAVLILMMALVIGSHFLMPHAHHSTSPTTAPAPAATIPAPTAQK